MKRRRRSTHYDRADLEGNLIWKNKCISPRNFDEFGVPAVAMFANHLCTAAKLFQATRAELANSAVCQIMYADPIARRDILDVGANFFDPARNFVPKRHRQV